MNSIRKAREAYRADATNKENKIGAEIEHPLSSDVCINGACMDQLRLPTGSVQMNISSD